MKKLLILPAWVVVAALALEAPFAGAGAQTAASCSFDPQARSLALSMPRGQVSSSLRRRGDAITFEQFDIGVFETQVVQCSGPQPTVTNTDTIVATDGGGKDPIDGLDIELSGGPFAPGATPEPDGTSEIEFEVSFGRGIFIGGGVTVYGTAGRDSIRLGELQNGSGVNLNASESEPDADVTFPGRRPDVFVVGEGGPDRISGNGGPEFTGPYDRGSIFVGERGADRLIGGERRDSLYGGRGPDRFRGLGGSDVIYARDGVKDSIHCGSGADDAEADGRDVLHSCEDVSVRPPPTR